MNLWNSYEDFSFDFLTKHHDLVLYNTFHHIKSFLLYPLECSCNGVCCCRQQRARIVLSLNVDLYTKAYKEGKDSAFLSTMKSLLNIPEDHLFRELHTQAYPIWLIEQQFEQREKGKHFKLVAQLIWSLLRLSKTLELSPWRESRASINEALELLLGKTPLKTKARKQNDEDYLGGEKAYRKHLKTYKSVCHFITAYDFLKEGNKSFSFESPEEIEKFLSVSHWFRTKLLSLQTPNVKENAFFLEEDLVPLPSWVKKEGIDIPLEPFEEKLQEINYAFETAEPLSSTRDYRR